MIKAFAYPLRVSGKPEELIVPHQYLGWIAVATLFRLRAGELADIVCNECDQVISTVPFAQARHFLERIAAQDETKYHQRRLSLRLAERSRDFP